MGTILSKHHTVGRAEKSVLKYLAKHPDQYIKPMSIKIGRDYKTIHEAVKRLQEKELIESFPKKNIKGVKYDAYRLTVSGVSYVLANTDINQTKIMDNYQDTVNLFQPYTRLRKTIDKSLMNDALKTVGKIHYTFGPNPSPEKTAVTALNIQALYGSISPERKKEMLKAIHEDKELSEALNQVAKSLGLKGLKF